VTAKHQVVKIPDQPEQWIAGFGRKAFEKQTRLENATRDVNKRSRMRAWR